MSSPLVLRVEREDSGYSRKDHNRFGLHRVLRDVPRHSRQRRRPIRRRRWGSGLRRDHRHLPAQPAIVVAMPCVPRSVRLTVPGSLALRSTAGSLPVSDACVGQEPSSAYATRTLLAHSALEHHRRAPNTASLFCAAAPRLPAAATPAAARSESRPRSTERSEGVAPSRARAALTPRPSGGFLLPPVHNRRLNRMPPAHWVISAKQVRVTPRERRSLELRRSDLDDVRYGKQRTQNGRERRRPMEEPALLVDDIRRFFRPQRG